MLLFNLFIWLYSEWPYSVKRWWNNYIVRRIHIGIWVHIGTDWMRTNVNIGIDLRANVYIGMRKYQCVHWYGNNTNVHIGIGVHIGTSMYNNHYHENPTEPFAHKK